ncbi:hypothetical protein SAMN05661099_0378 [Daejeonella lutea]|uniref:Uncharacterized protein n=1 Tax=Daejeonella lutea TaxID=572036 RepID=A0A1T5A6E9_9SPHI|nr:hypothetical protein SAMN05661099_0378 [Daejeonella lutea]
MANSVLISFDPAKIKLLSQPHVYLVTPKQKESNVWHNASYWGTLAVIFTEQQAANYSNLILTLLN